MNWIKEKVKNVWTWVFIVVLGGGIAIAAPADFIRPIGGADNCEILSGVEKIPEITVCFDPKLGDVHYEEALYDTPAGENLWPYITSVEINNQTKQDISFNISSEKSGLLTISAKAGTKESWKSPRGLNYTMWATESKTERKEDIIILSI